MDYIKISLCLAILSGICQLGYIYSLTIDRNILRKYKDVLLSSSTFFIIYSLWLLWFWFMKTFICDRANFDNKNYIEI